VRVAVIGHVEWVQFARVQHVPAPGEIVHATDTWEEAAGGGAVAAVQLVKLAGGATLYTTLGDDVFGRRARRGLEDHGVRVEAIFRKGPQRRAFTHIDVRGERTITTMGERMGPSGSDPLPWDELAGADAVYFTAGDRGAIEGGRRASVLVATSRVLPDLIAAGLQLDGLVGSGRDPAERYRPGSLIPPRLAVATTGASGGTYLTSDGESGEFAAAPIPGPISDAYGCGDSFAAGLTYALGAGYPTLEALALAARCGAACLTGRGPYAGQLSLVERMGDRPCEGGSTIAS
jgi:ribokinase